MLPVLIKIGWFELRSYGLMLVVGFLIGLQRAMKVCERRMKTEPEGSPRRIDPDTAFNVGVMALLIGIVGARLVFVLQDWSHYKNDLLNAAQIWRGGLSLHGAMLFGILFLIVYSRLKKISLLALGDLCAPSWAIAYVFGRIGCFLNGCCYGGVCDLPWAVRFPDEHNPHALTPPSHPTQLYAALINLVFFFWLVWWEKRPRRDGELFFGYIAMYGVYRFIVDLFRAGTTSTWTTLLPGVHLTDTHIVSLLMVIAGLTGMALVRRRLPAIQDAAFTS